MIQIVKRGDFRLVEISAKKKILILDNRHCFLWKIEENGIENLYPIEKIELKKYGTHGGKYRVYKVYSKDRSLGVTQLEFLWKSGIWKGYILAQGFPQKHLLSSPIKSTRELITKTCMWCLTFH